MRRKKLIASLLIAAMTTTMLAGCGAKQPSGDAGDTSDTPKQEQPATTGLYPGTPDENAITVNISTEPPNLFSVKSTDTTSSDVLRHVLETLVELDANDQVIPGVAKEWTVSDDGLTYNFKLRDDMKWSNGEPVTAHDFVFAWTSLLSPEIASEYAYFGYVFKNGLAFSEGKVGADELGFKAVSDYELEVTLENPTSYFLGSLAYKSFAPLNEKAYKEFGEAYGTDADKMVYNGPYKIASWEHENKIVLEKNPDYYDADNVELEKINMVMINDSNAAMNAFKAGELDVAGLNGEQLKMMETENYPFYTYEDGSNFYMEYNLSNKYLANKNLRQAITYAIDKQAYVDNIVKNSSKAATSFTASTIDGLNGKFIDEVGPVVPVLDVEKAKELYEKALSELGVDKVELAMIADDTDAAVNTAAFIQEQLKVNLGIDVKVESMPFKSRLARMTSKDFDIVFAGWGPDYNDPMTYLDMFETGNGNNHTGYSNPEYDKLLDKVRTEADKEKRFGYLVELEKMLLDDMPVGPVYFRAKDYVVSEKIASGAVRTAFQDMNFIGVKLAK